MTTVDRVATPITAQDLANAISDVWASVVGGDPGQAIPVFIAQSAFETGEWKSIWNYNVGNVAGSGPSGNSYTATANPTAGGVTSAEAPHVWRAYDTLAEGVTDWLKVFAQGYPQSVAAAVKADIPGFIEGMFHGWGRDAQYFQAKGNDRANYQAGVQRFYNKYQNVAPTDVGPPTPPSSTSTTPAPAPAPESAPAPDSEPPSNIAQQTISTLRNDFANAVDNILGSVPSMPSMPSVPSLTPSPASKSFLGSWGLPLAFALGFGFVGWQMRKEPSL
jgi:hypothetical protein